MDVEKASGKSIDDPIPFPRTSPTKSQKVTILRAIAVLALGAIAFRTTHRFVKGHFRCNHHATYADPDTRGRLTIKQVEELFLYVRLLIVWGHDADLVSSV